MDDKRFISEVKKGIKQAFAPALSDDELDEYLCPFDPMLYGDRSQCIGDGAIALLNHPVELIVTCEQELPCVTDIVLTAGVTSARHGRVYAVIEALEKESGEQVIFSDVNEIDPLIMNFTYSVERAEQISAAIVDVVSRLTSGRCAPLIEELLRLCGE